MEDFSDKRCDVAPLDVRQSLDVENLCSNLFFLVVVMVIVIVRVGFFSWAMSS